MKFFTCLIFIPGFLIGCNQSKVDLKTERNNIMKTDSAWSELARNGGDVEKIISYWSDDAVVVAPGQPVVKGKDALRKMVTDSKNIPGFSISWKSSDINFSPDGQLAYMSGENLMTMNDSTGKKISIPGRGYTIWRKEVNGDWKCVVDIWNN
jgi:ketosteroid isomerase-like protein